MIKIQVGDTVVYTEGALEWTAEVQGVDAETLTVVTVVTVGKNGDYSEAHFLSSKDVVRIAAHHV